MWRFRSEKVALCDGSVGVFICSRMALQPVTAIGMHVQYTHSLKNRAEFTTVVILGSGAPNEYSNAEQTC